MSALPSSPAAISATPVAAPASAAGPEREKLAAASKQFEAIFVRQMLAAARKADFGGSDLFGGEALGTFRQMQDERFADLAAERGSFGIAKMIEARLGDRASIDAIPPRNGEVAAKRTEGSQISAGVASAERRDPSVIPYGAATSPFRGGFRSSQGKGT